MAAAVAVAAAAHLRDLFVLLAVADAREGHT
jgi:hypothetical protein